MAETLLTQDLRRITVTLAADERDALRALAFQERRDARQQAALIIRHELERLGLLVADDVTETAAQTSLFEAS